MSNERPSQEQILRAALAAGNDCPSIEQLERFLEQEASASGIVAKHVESCSHCQTELHLLQDFQRGQPGETESDAVRLITNRLRSRSAEIFPQVSAAKQLREPWWREIWMARWLSPAALAMAGALVLVTIGLQLRQAPPGIRPTAVEQEVLRSGALSVTTPVGDLQEVPAEARWQPAPNAMRYEVRLLEVDGTELWKGATTENRIELPAAIRKRIAPAKTLVLKVSAFDASGHNVAEYDTTRFRVLQNLYKP